MPPSRLVVKVISRLAVIVRLATVIGIEWIVTHWPVINDQTKRRADRLQPFARGPHRIAARLALAFEQARRLLLRPHRLATGVEPGMGRGASSALNNGAMPVAIRFSQLS